MRTRQVVERNTDYPDPEDEKIAAANRNEMKPGMGNGKKQINRPL
ncbi:hypothetical protein [Sphingobacterium sp. N143]|nr:hypothetical protein [Sphingobacterium sp. N143]